VTGQLYRADVDGDVPVDAGRIVAATIAGIGADGLHKGVAPGAHLVSARVCGPPGCPESAILAGMQWLADQGVKVINMSLGGPDSLDRDPLEETVDRISAQSGVLFVIAAGNDGEFGDETVSSPGSTDAALTVGAVTKQDDLADFSGRGPRLGDGALKPDITAPGVNIVAAQSRDAIDRDPTVERVAKSGTSMATPHVTGGAAILLQQHPDWTRAQLKNALMGSARTNPAIGVYAQGAGRLDVARAVRQTVLADPPSVSVQDQWPLERKPISRTVTYRNTGTAPVTLALDLRTTAPAGMFTVSARTVTVPAGGVASVRLDIRTTVRGVAPHDTGYLVATAGDTVVTTPFVAAVETEPTFQVGVDHIDRDGGPAADALSALVDLDREQAVEIPSGAAPRRLPKGHYAILTVFVTGDAETVTLLVKPLLVVDRDLKVTMDARTARPVSVRLPLSDAEAFYTSAFTTASGPRTGVIYSIFGAGDGFGHFFFGPDDPGRRNPAVESGFSALLGKRGTVPENSPYIADVAWRERGRMFPGLKRTVTWADLATVRAEYAHHALAAGTVDYTSVWPDGTFTLTDQTPVRLPSARVEYLNTDGGIQRQVVLKEGNLFDGLGNALASPLRTFTGGRTYRERRNAAVYGPGFTDPPLFDNGSVLRMGDTVRLRPTLLDDALNWGGFATSGQRAHLTLDRDGTRVFDRSGNAFDVTVPAGAATYRLGADLTRSGPQMALSTRVTCAWTFHSGTTPRDRWTPLPLSAVRFLPPLDLENAAPAGTRVTVPFEIQRQPGSAAGTVREVRVQVSFDDGTTWLPAQVFRHDQRGVVLVNHPAGPGFVSLRASTVDAAGNTVEETILRAYRTG
jgi:Subtilase family